MRRPIWLVSTSCAAHGVAASIARMGRTARVIMDNVSGAASVMATQLKLEAESGLPRPSQRATCPNGHTGRVRSTTPLVRCDASIRAGAVPVAIQDSMAPILSNVSVPGPPMQWPMPGTM